MCRDNPDNPLVCLFPDSADKSLLLKVVYKVYLPNWGNGKHLCDVTHADPKEGGRIQNFSYYRA